MEDIYGVVNKSEILSKLNYHLCKYQWWTMNLENLKDKLFKIAVKDLFYDMEENLNYKSCILNDYDGADEDSPYILEVSLGGGYDLDFIINDDGELVLTEEHFYYSGFSRPLEDYIIIGEPTAYNINKVTKLFITKGKRHNTDNPSMKELFNKNILETDSDSD